MSISIGMCRATVALLSNRKKLTRVAFIDRFSAEISCSFLGPPPATTST
ncbi:hypothetical protein [Burkholderia ubonensis]|nr:hypothetical protein [Burkholderia ubonensis]